MLAFLLARGGVPVTLLESHSDFELASFAATRSTPQPWSYPGPARTF